MLTRLAEGRVHAAGGEDPCNLVAGHGSGTTGESVVRREVRELLPAKVTYRRVVPPVFPIEPDDPTRETRLYVYNLSPQTTSCRLRDFVFEKFPTLCGGRSDHQ